MERIQKIAAALIALGSLSSCGLFDSGVEWRGGPYSLMWIDTAENISLCREVSEGGYVGRVDATVFAVGWDGRYAVAKQHPLGDRSKTYYFIVDSRRDSPNAGASQAVIGPLDGEQYKAQALALKLPEFTKTLESLQ